MNKAEKKQLRYDTAYMRMAMEWAKLSHCQRKQVGSLIVKDRMIISDGYNGTPTGFENACEDEAHYTRPIKLTKWNGFDICSGLLQTFKEQRECRVL